MADYSKYQYSIFTHNGHDGQYVVRTDDKEEFEMLVTYVQAKVKPTEATQTVINQNPTCPIHNKEMTLGKWGWYCRTKTGDGPKDWCKYNPAEKESKEAFNGTNHN